MKTTKVCKRCGKEYTKYVSLAKKQWEKRKYCSRECSGNYIKTHGYSDHRLYKVWQGIKSRCYNKNNKHYKNYGGRGIKVCDEWLSSPKSFVDWAIENGAQVGLDIDRINNDGNYEPSNCRFVTREVNCKNKRDVSIFNGETMIDASKRLGGAPALVQQRIVILGWSIEDAFTIPKTKSRIKIKR